VADYCDYLGPLAAALTDSEDEAAALLAAALFRLRREGERVRRLTFPSAELLRGLVGEFLRRRGRSDAVDGPGPLQALTRPQRAAWVLREVEHLTLAEIATATDQPVGAVARDLTPAAASIGGNGPAGPEEIRQRLRDSATRIPEVNAVRAALRRQVAIRSRRRGRAWSAALGVCVLAVVLVLVDVLVLPRLPVFVRGPGERVFMHTIQPPAGWHVQARILRQTDESSVVSRDFGGEQSCLVTVRLPGSFPTAPPPDRVGVKVRGRSGFYSEGSTDPRESGPRLGWSYAGSGSAAVSCSPRTAEDSGAAGRENLREIAESVTFEREPVRLPFALATLPKGYVVQSITQVPSTGHTSVLLATSASETSTASLEVTYPGGEPAGAEVSPATIPVDGRRGLLSRDPDRPTLCLEVGDETACVTAGWSSPTAGWGSAVPSSVITLLTDVASSMTYAPSLSDPRSWFDAATALP